MSRQKLIRTVRGAFNLGAVITAFVILIIILSGSVKSIAYPLVYLASIDSCICVLNAILKDRKDAIRNIVHVGMWLLLASISFNV